MKILNYKLVALLLAAAITLRSACKQPRGDPVRGDPPRRNSPWAFRELRK